MRYREWLQDDYSVDVVPLFWATMPDGKPLMEIPNYHDNINQEWMDTSLKKMHEMGTLTEEHMAEWVSFFADIDTKVSRWEKVVSEEVPTKFKPKDGK